VAAAAKAAAVAATTDFMRVGGGVAATFAVAFAGLPFAAATALGRAARLGDDTPPFCSLLALAAAAASSATSAASLSPIASSCVATDGFFAGLPLSGRCCPVGVLFVAAAPNGSKSAVSLLASGVLVSACSTADRISAAADADMRDPNGGNDAG